MLSLSEVLWQSQCFQPMTVPQNMVVPLTYSHENALDVCRRELQNWDSRSARFTDPLATAELMARLAKTPERSVEVRLHVESVSGNLMESIKALRDETPSVLTEENKPVVKHLKTRKRKLLAETLKEIRLMGFRSNMDYESLSKQATLGQILTNASLSNATNVDLLTAENYFHSALPDIVAIRSQIGDHSSDLNGQEVARSTEFIESILAAVLHQRSFLANAYAHASSFESTLEVAQSVWRPESYSVQAGRAPSPADGRCLQKFEVATTDT